MGFPVLLITGEAETAAPNGDAAGAPKLGAVGVGALLKLKFAPPILALAENPLPPNDGVLGVGLGAPPLLAAFRASILASLSLPASMIPDSVPVKNVAIGMINSKNF